MVDPVGFRLHNSNSILMRPWVYSQNAMNGQLEFTEEEYLCCAYWINGFSLTHKIWCTMAVEGVQDVQWNHGAFKKLVIDEDRRDLIHGLVKAHRNDETAFDDIIRNKGQGLVGLLSGSPGVGKTLTAEAVSEVTERPLYSVSAGELGIKTADVDEKLGMILSISRRWGCVLLIDEADVFLGVRGENMQRDSLVSIFLRRLEYFRGVCILTTNRRSEIDPAFQSESTFLIVFACRVQQHHCLITNHPIPPSDFPHQVASTSRSTIPSSTKRAASPYGKTSSAPSPALPKWQISARAMSRGWPSTFSMDGRSRTSSLARCRWRGSRIRPSRWRGWSRCSRS